MMTTTIIMISRRNRRSLIVSLALHFFLLHVIISSCWFRHEGHMSRAVVQAAFSIIMVKHQTTSRKNAPPPTKAFSFMATTMTNSNNAPPPTKTTTSRVCSVAATKSATEEAVVSRRPAEIIITGPMGKPASSREEDLRLTIQVILDFYNKHFLADKQQYEHVKIEKDHVVVVVSDVKVQEKVATGAVFSEDADESSSSSEDKAATATVTTAKVPDEAILKTCMKDDVDTIVVVDENKFFLHEIMETTLSRPAFRGALTRLAAAFGQGLLQQPLSRIASVSVISLSSTQIELGALICEDGVCVNVAVPIPFIKPCTSSSNVGDNNDLLEQCILDAINELDVLATQRIEASERAALPVNSEQISWEQGLFQELQDDSITPVFPDWWTEPIGNWELQDECVTLKRLLNEDDFQMERHTLVQQQLQQQQQNQQQQHLPGKVTHVAVAFVGTSGLLVRANLELKDDDDEVRNRIVDLPLPFLKGTVEARTVDDLRDAVLELVDSVAVI